MTVGGKVRQQICRADSETNRTEKQSVVLDCGLPPLAEGPSIKQLWPQALKTGQIWLTPVYTFSDMINL